MFGGGGDSESMSSKLAQTKKVIEEVNKQFKNPVRGDVFSSIFFFF